MKTKKLLFPFIFLSLVFLDRDFSTGYGRFNSKSPLTENARNGSSFAPQHSSEGIAAPSDLTKSCPFCRSATRESPFRPEHHSTSPASNDGKSEIVATLLAFQDPAWSRPFTDVSEFLPPSCATKDCRRVTVTRSVINCDRRLRLR
jgi:hypothetical protein